MGQGRSGILTAKHVTFSALDDSPRLVLPRTLVLVLSHLLDELGEHDHRRCHLMTARDAVSRAYRLKRNSEPLTLQEIHAELEDSEDSP